MSDCEDDYMSDKFLAGVADVRPSLINSRVKKRQIQVETKKVEIIKKQRESCAADKRNERLQESLNRPIAADNKGFQMLAKMGYKPGATLGKSERNNAIKEPIAINLKSDRGGLGRDAALAELAAKRAQLQREHLLRKAGIDNTNAISTQAYRQRATQKAEERQLQHNLKCCQQTCETLDQAAHVDAPEMEFFWPERVSAAIEDEEEGEEEKQNEAKEDEVEEEYSNADKMELLTSYLRTAYQFCYWCGTRYENENDMDEHCPGLTRDDH